MTLTPYQKHMKKRIPVVGFKKAVQEWNTKKKGSTKRKTMTKRKTTTKRKTVTKKKGPTKRKTKTTPYLSRRYRPRPRTPLKKLRVLALKYGVTFRYIKVIDKGILVEMPSVTAKRENEIFTIPLILLSRMGTILKQQIGFIANYRGNTARMTLNNNKANRKKIKALMEMGLARQISLKEFFEWRR